MCRKLLAILIISSLMLFATQPALAVYGVYDPPSSGGGGGGGGPALPPPEPTPVTSVVKTPDDQALDNSLRATGTALIDLGSKAEGKAELSPALVGKLVEENLPLTVENKEVKLELPTGALNHSLVQNNLNNDAAKVEIGAQAVSPQEQQEIISRTPVGQSTGIFSVGSVIVNLTAAVVTDSGSTPIESFAEPVAVTIDLSALELTQEEISQLTGTRLELDANGNYVTVNLGGTYDPRTKTFTFYTDRFSLYTVLRVENLVNLILKIDSQIGTFNSVNKMMDAAPVIINNRTMVPLRYVGEALGATFEWDEKARKVTFTREGKTLSLTIDKLQPGLDTPAIIRSGRTMVPIRYISESFGATVNWFPSTRTVQVIK